MQRFRSLSWDAGGSPLRHFQHPLAEVQAGHARAAPGQRQGEVAGAAAKVQRALAGLRPGQLDHAAFPMPVQAKALEVIDQVITRRDAGEEIMHLRSALVGTTKVFPLSAGRLAIGTWQQIMLCDFDNRARDREITVTVIGE